MYDVAIEVSAWILDTATLLLITMCSSANEA